MLWPSMAKTASAVLLSVCPSGCANRWFYSKKRLHKQHELRQHKSHELLQLLSRANSVSDVLQHLSMMQWAPT